MTAGAAPGPTTVSLRNALRALGAVLLAVALVELALLADGVDAPLWALALFPALGLLWAGTGLLAWSRRPSNGTGPLLVLGGCAFLLAALENTALRPLAVAGALVSGLVLAVSIHVLLAFPSGRLQGRAARATAGTAYALAVLGPLPARLFTAGSPLEVADRPELAAASGVLEPLSGLVAVPVAVLLAQRLRRAAPPERRVLRPLFAYGIVSTVGITFAAQLQHLLGLSDVLRFVLQVLALAVVPVAFGAVLLAGGFARTGAVEELGSLLGEERTPTQDVIARVLGDPTLQLLHWLPTEQGWVDRAGRHRDVGDEAGRGLVEVTVGGRRAGALTYDADLISDPELVRAAARPAGLALEAERLAVELRRSRARLVAAADHERRRLGRDLHDGLQVRLVLLALEAGTLAARAPDPATAEALQRLRLDVDTAAAELRRTVQSLLPAALVERGLAAALEDLVDRLPVPARLDVGPVPDDLPGPVVTTAWYVLSEAVTNALKHAAPTKLEVVLGVRGEQLVVEVADDGAGGAALQDGTGLRGLVDRLDVVHGRLEVDSPLGAGTRVRAQIPVEG